jgi:hypothetical protein
VKEREEEREKGKVSLFILFIIIIIYKSLILRIISNNKEKRILIN